MQLHPPNGFSEGGGEGRLHEAAGTGAAVRTVGYPSPGWATNWSQENKQATVQKRKPRATCVLGRLGVAMECGMRYAVFGMQYAVVAAGRDLGCPRWPLSSYGA